MTEYFAVSLDETMRDDPKAQARLDLIRLFLAHWRGSLIAITLITAGVMLAWRDYAPLQTRMLWLALTTINYAAQAFVFWKLESAPSLQNAVSRWMPWLLSSLAISGVMWGLVPWMVAGTSSAALLFACIFNLMLVFCVVNSPGTPTIVLCAVLPFLLVTVPALIQFPNFLYEGIICAVLFVVIGFYGVRVQRALEATMTERHIAGDLAENLHRHQAKLVQMENERTLLVERERLMRDMHDGIGSALASALTLAERSDAQQEEVAELLRECIEDLRLVIDSLEPIDNDLVALLAALRFRMERRIGGAGLCLEWDMRDLPVLPWMGPSETLHVLRLVQEVLNNVIKHARANLIQLSVRDCSTQVEVLIVDDGCGFDTALTFSGRGLKTMQQRARSLGGALHIESQPDYGTRVLLALPIHKQAIPARV